jgi:hypothetical protein
MKGPDQSAARCQAWFSQVHLIQSVAAGDGRTFLTAESLMFLRGKLQIHARRAFD